MAFQRFEHVMAPEGTVDAMRELIEGVEKHIEQWRAVAVTLDRLSGEDTDPTRKGWFAGRAAAYGSAAAELEAILKPGQARAALGEEASNG